MLLRYIMMFTAASLLTACNFGPKSSHGFTLPDGDAVKGQAIFSANACQSCHSISSLPELRDTIDPEMSITLGGKTTRIKTYGELVTSVINPSHKLAGRYPKDLVSENGVSKMTNYNDVLTVSELIDLVAFLQSQYELYETPRTGYFPYTY